MDFNMFKFEIEVHPTTEPEPKPVTKKKSRSKFHWPWRINMLAKSRPPVTPKYVAPPPVPKPRKVFTPLDPGTEFRAEHLARVFIRILEENRREVRRQHWLKLEKQLGISLEKSWNSIYNYYRKRLRDKELKRLQQRKQKRDAKKPKGKALEELNQKRGERLGKLATPKKLFLPEKIPRLWRALDELIRMDLLATPKQRDIKPPREIGKVASEALRYEITEELRKLAQPLERRRKQEDVKVIGAVSKGALRYKATPLIEKLAEPSSSAKQAKQVDDYDPFVISPTALKYKATPRILELAKPLERE